MAESLNGVLVILQQLASLIRGEGLFLLALPLVGQVLIMLVNLFVIHFIILEKLIIMVGEIRHLEKPLL